MGKAPVQGKQLAIHLSSCSALVVDRALKARFIYIFSQYGNLD